MNAVETETQLYRFPVAVRGVMIREQSVLLMPQAGATWDLPGIQAGGNEALKACLQQALQEEWALPAQVEQLLNISVQTVSIDTHVVVVAYGCRLQGAAACGQWVKLTEVPKLALPIGYKRAIRQWAAAIQATVRQPADASPPTAT